MTFAYCLFMIASLKKVKVQVLKYFFLFDILLLYKKSIYLLIFEKTNI